MWFRIRVDIQSSGTQIFGYPLRSLVQSDMQQRTLASDKLVCYQTQQLHKFVSPVPDQKALAIDALSLSWEGLDLYGFPTVALLGKVITGMSLT